MLASVPESTQSAQTELGLQIAFGYALIPVKGWASTETAAAFTRAGELCTLIGEVPQFCAPWGAPSTSCAATSARRARQQTNAWDCPADRGCRQPDRGALSARHGSSATGEFSSARTLLERSVELYGKRDLHALLYGQDPKASALSWLAMDLWVLGYPDQALARARDSFAFVQSVSNPFAIARSLADWDSCTSTARPAARRTAGRRLHCAWTGFPYFRAVVSTFQASNLALLGTSTRRRRCCARASSGCARSARNCCSLSSPAIWRNCASPVASTTKAWPQWPRDWRWWSATANTGASRSCTACAAICSSPRPRARRKPKHPSSAQSGRRVLARRAPTSRARPPAWRGCGEPRASAPMHGPRCARSTVGEGLDTPDLKEAAALLKELS